MSIPACVIGRQIRVKGTVYGEMPMVVAGEVEGTLQSKAPLVVETTGSVKAQIQCGEILIRGEIAGDVEASEQIQLVRGSRVIGDLHAPEILMEEGAQFQGRVEMDFEVPPLEELK
ncbi:MAG: polymer-forming cytoskeletal protein [Deltaproteobacteria bacterium]|nr:polymer-forming cytoskeletal protein [Deltaproteobacteria bacterium]